METLVSEVCEILKFHLINNLRKVLGENSLAGMSFDGSASCWKGYCEPQLKKNDMVIELDTFSSVVSPTRQYANHHFVDVYKVIFVLD